MKRYSETEKWRDPWFRELSMATKCAFEYMRDNCDNAGVWEPDRRLANFSIKADLDWEEIAEEMGDRVEVLPNGKWWLTRFVRYQLNGKPLRPDSIPAHAKIVRCLAEAGIAPDNPWITGIGLRSLLGVGTAEKPAEEAQLPGFKPPVVVAFPDKLNTPAFAQTWESWLCYRRERKLSVLKPTSLRHQFAELESWGLDRAMAAIRQSIRQGWQGIFEEKQNGTTNSHGGRNGRSFEQRGDYSQITEKV